MMRSITAYKHIASEADPVAADIDLNIALLGLFFKTDAPLEAKTQISSLISLLPLY